MDVGRQGHEDGGEQNHDDLFLEVQNRFELLEARVRQHHAHDGHRQQTTFWREDIAEAKCQQHPRQHRRIDEMFGQPLPPQGQRRQSTHQQPKRRAVADECAHMSQSGGQRRARGVTAHPLERNRRCQRANRVDQDALPAQHAADAGIRADVAQQRRDHGGASHDDEGPEQRRHPPGKPGDEVRRRRPQHPGDDRPPRDQPRDCSPVARNVGEAQRQPALEEDEGDGERGHQRNPLSSQDVARLDDVPQGTEGKSDQQQRQNGRNPEARGNELREDAQRHDDGEGDDGMVEVVEHPPHPTQPSWGPAEARPLSQDSA